MNLSKRELQVNKKAEFEPKGKKLKQGFLCMWEVVWYRYFQRKTFSIHMISHFHRPLTLSHTWLATQRGILLQSHAAAAARTGVAWLLVPIKRQAAWMKTTAGWGFPVKPQQKRQISLLQLLFHSPGHERAPSKNGNSCDRPAQCSQVGGRW